MPRIQPGLITVVVALAATLGCERTAKISRDLTSVAEIRGVAPEQVPLGIRARIRGIVTFAAASADSCFVQDATGGVRVQLPKGQMIAEAGQRIDVLGMVSAGGDMPSLVDAQFSLLGSAPLPAPVRLPSEPSLQRRLLYRRVSIQGLVHTAFESENEVTKLVVKSGRLMVPVIRLNSFPGETGAFVGAEVRADGVLAGLPDPVYSPDTDALLTTRPEDTVILRPAIAGEDLPVMPVSALLQLRPEKLPQGRVRVQGRGRLSSQGGVSLQDESAVVTVLPAPAGLQNLNGKLDLAGFPSWRSGSVVLEDAADVVPNSGRSARLPLLTSAKDVHRLPASQAAMKYPVRVRGVVTFSDHFNSLLFIQDQTDGVFAYIAPSLQEGLRPGDFVELQGESIPGDFAPSVMVSRLIRLGHAPLPDADRDHVEEALTGQLDSRWIELQGALQSVSAGSRESVANLVSGTHSFRAHILAPVQELAPLVNSVVRIRGVCGALFNNRRQLLGIVVYVPGHNFIQVVEPAPQDPFGSPVRPIESLLQYSSAGVSGRRIHVEGFVALSGPTGPTWIRDATGAVLVRDHDQQNLTPGDLIEVAGFPFAGPYSPVLTGSVIRKIATGPAPRALVISPLQALSGKYDGQLVQMEGTVFDRSPRPGKFLLRLESGLTQFAAEVPAKAGFLAPETGSVLRVTGICSVLVDDSRDGVVPLGFQVIARSPSDVTVLQSAPWLTFGKLVPLLAVTVVMAGITLLWASRLRHRVKAQTEALIVKTGQLEKAHQQATKALLRAQEAESMEQAHKDVLELVARDEDLEDVLSRLAQAIEDHCLGISCSIQLCLPDGKRIGASPSLANEWQRALQAIEIHEFCAEGIHEIEGVSAQPAWREASQSAAAARLRRFHLVQIHQDGFVIGVIVAFLAGDVSLRRSEQEFLDSAAKLAALAVQRRVMYDQLSYRARHDPLTGIENRASLFDKLNREIAIARANGSILGLIYIDLDQFKSVNDSYGHPAGDAVLQAVCKRMLTVIRRADTLARLGGDEFAILIPNLGERKDALRIASHLVQSISTPIQFNGHELTVGASVGISVFPADGHNAEALIQAADVRMYHEKIGRVADRYTLTN
ncbi:MAG: sensor domain-containing diguanylate cyclase [Bryobacteraceae bacterium]